MVLAILNLPKSFGHVFLALLLLEKATHCNDMGDTVFVVPSLEGDHLVISLVGYFYLDLFLFLLLIKICRVNIWDWEPIDNIPPFALRTFESLRQAFLYSR